MVKECPASKIVNPKSGRCVNRSGKIGAALLKKKPVTRRKKKKPVTRCKRQTDCKATYLCDPIEKKCVKRDRNNTVHRVITNAGVGDVAPKDPRTWDKLPGQGGFNEYAQARMAKTKVIKGLSISCSKRGLMPYQATSKWMVSPATPMNRFLAVHRTGSGKTLTMISILDNYFDDKRSKVLIFPNMSVANNFYVEILKFPSKYRTFLVAKLGKHILDDAKVASKLSALTRKVADTLAMKGNLSSAGKKGQLKAPLRATRYTVAGGSSVVPTPKLPIFKRGYDGKNSYSNKIILMDEIHNLIVPSAEASRYSSKLVALRAGLKKATGSVIVGFTATPIVNSVDDGEKLLALVKGDENADGGDEGFVSYFNSLPHSMYPRVDRPNGVANIALFDVQGDTFKGAQKMNLGAYKNALKTLKLTNMTTLPEDPKVVRKLMNMINMSSSYGHITQSKWLEKYTADPMNYGSKIDQLVKLVASRQQKSLILVHRSTGYKAFVQAFNLVNSDSKWKCPSRCWCSMYDNSENSCLADFNSDKNKDGSVVRTMIVDALNFSEGVSFLGVRHIYMLNPPVGYGSYKQRVGRVLRACGYENLQPNQRNVSVTVCVGNTGQGTPSIDQIAMDALLAKHTEDETRMARFRNIAVDKPFIEQFK